MDLQDEIDELAVAIERKIQQNEKRLREIPDYNPMYRRMEEADPAELFSG